MPTLEEKLSNTLVDHGMWPNEAQAVMASVKESPVMESMKGRWGQAAEGYPPQMLGVLWMTVKDEAVKWIDANKPQHWAKALLTGVMPGGPSAAPN